MADLSERPVGDATTARILRWVRHGGTVTRALRRDRVAGYVAVGIVVLLVAAVVGFGGGARAVVPHISDIGAWLTNTKLGSVTHANGLSGKADARIGLTNAAGHPLSVTQQGNIVLVTDTVTGVVSRIDPGQLTVTQSVNYGAKDVRVVSGAGLAYELDPAKGIVQQIDPTQLSVIGNAITLTPTLGAAGIDAQGILWVPVPATGQVVPVRNGTAGTPIHAGQPNEPLILTIAAGQPVVTNIAQATMTVLSPSGGQATVNLPSGTASRSADGLLAPASTESAVVPLIVSGSHQLVLVNTATSTMSSVTLANATSDDLGAPQVLDNRVYVPDNTTGRLVVYDAVGGQLLNQIAVTGQPGHLDMFVQNHMLWVNDADSPNAISVDSSGTARQIGKYDPQLAGGPLPTTSSADAPQQPGAGNPGSGGNGGIPTGGNTGSNGGNTGGRNNGGGVLPVLPATTTPPPSTSAVVPVPSSGPTTTPPTTTTTTPPEQPPGSVTETAQAGSILVNFTQASAAAPLNYTLSGTPNGAVVNPPTVLPSGQPQFTVSGLNCSQTYQFTVVANYPGGGQQSTKAQGGVRPCTAPKAPQNVQLNTSTQHQLGVSWSPPSSDGGSGSVTYNVSWGSPSPHNGLTGTSDTITGLTNFNSYTVTVVAVNPAGQSPAATHPQTKLSQGPWQGTIYNNSSAPVMVRPTPDINGNPVGQFPVNSHPSVQVECQTPGGTWSDRWDPTLRGNTWYKISSSYGNGYVATGYVNTSGVWSCS